jgi:hypothetical protein
MTRREAFGHFMRFLAASPLVMHAQKKHSEIQDPDL